MTDILRLIEKYEVLDEDKIILHPDLAQDITAIATAIDKASADEKSTAKKFLENLATVIQKRIHDLEENLKSKPQAMDNVRKTMEACLAYSKARTKEG